MSVIGELEVVLTASSTGLISGLNTALQSVSSFNQVLGSQELNLKTAGLASAALGVGILGLSAAIGGTAVNAATDWNKRLVETGNNAGMTATQIRDMGTAVLNLASQTGASNDQLLKAYMYIHDMGYGGKQAFDLLNSAAKEAVATGSDVSQTASTLATVMHEFNIPVDGALKAMDMLHAAAASARMTVQDMVTSFGPVGSIAAQIGIPLEETAAAMAALTRNGYDASRAATQVQDILVHIENPAKAAQKELAALSQTTGIDLVHDFSEAGLRSKGLVGVLNDMQKATGGSSQEMMKLIPALRGGLGASALVGKAHRDMIDILAAEQKSVGSTSSAYSLYSNTTAAQTARMHENFHQLQVTLGNALIPVVNKLLEALLPIIQTTTTWIEQHPKLAAGILMSVAAIGALLVVIPLIVTAIGAIASPIGLVLAGIAALVVGLTMGITLMRNNWQAFVAYIQLAVGWITANFQKILVFLGPAGLLVSGILEVHKHWSDILGSIQSAWGGFTGFISGQINQMLGYFDNLKKRASDALSYLNPFAKHSPSLVDQVTSGVSVIRSQYQSLSNLSMPSLAPSFSSLGNMGASSVGNYNASTYKTNNVTLNNTFNVQGEANASNTAAFLGFQLEHLGIV